MTTAGQRYAMRTIPIALMAIACWTCVIAKAVLELFVKSRLGALGSRMNANQMISATSSPSAMDVAPATPRTHRRNVAPMMDITKATTKPGAGFPASSGFIPSAAIQRRPNSGGENQTAPMINALTPASTIAIQLKLDASKDTTASDPGRATIEGPYSFGCPARTPVAMVLLAMAHLPSLRKDPHRLLSHLDHHST